MGSPLLRQAFTLILTFVFVQAGVRTADAQDTAPPHLSVVDGSATLEREQTIEPANPGVVLVAGDRLRSTGGRVEILFADGSVLDVDEHTTIDVQSERLLRLSNGRVLLTVAGASNPGAAIRYQIDTPAASVMTEGPGEYRVAAFDGSNGIQSELAVLRGRASLTNDIGATLVRAGERTVALERYAPGRPEIFNSARYDAFDRWVSARRSDRLGTVSTQYLPQDLYGYSGTLDRYGSWSYEPSYGNVWYPTVASTWRPYYDGYWSPVPRYGWTWTGGAPWAWPTHHYGRWGYNRSRWFWVPGYHWSPAWVSWAYSPGYVSWCPLGFDNRPVFSLSVGVNVGWGGWVGVNYNHFSPRYHVPRYAVGAPGPGVRSALVVRNEAPALPPRAAGRRADARSPQAAPGVAGTGRPFTNADVDRRAVARQGASDPVVRDGLGPTTGRDREIDPASQDLFKRAIPAGARARDAGPRANPTGPTPDTPGTAGPAGARSARDRRGTVNGSASTESRGPALSPAVPPLSPAIPPLSPTVRPLTPAVRPVQPDARVNPYDRAPGGARPSTRDLRSVAPRAEPTPQTGDAPPASSGSRSRSAAPRDDRPAVAPAPRSRESQAPAPRAREAQAPPSAPAPSRRAAESGGASSGGGGGEAAAPARPGGGPPAGARSRR